MDKKLLLIIDMQKAIADEKPYAYEEVEKNIAKLLNHYRNNNFPIIFIQHDGSKGSEFEPGINSWEIVDKLKPQESEIIINKKYNSAFKKTTLESELIKKGINKLIIVGMQTEYCIDTTIRVAFEKGYEIIIPEMTNTTVDNGLLTGEQIYKHHNNILNNRFALIKTVEEVLNSK